MKTPIELTRRQITLETLRSSGALFHWHPSLVDAALDLPGAYRRIEALIDDPVFYAGEVERLKSLAPSLAEMLGENVAASLRDRSLPLEAPFLHSMRRNALARMRLAVDGNRLLADEIDERARMEYLRMAARYLPGRMEADGTVRTFGFKAFLETQMPYKLRDIIRQCMAAFGRTDYVDDLDQRLIAPAREIASDVAGVILDAIRNALRSSREVKLLEAFLSEDGALADFSADEGTSTGKLRRDIEVIFSRAALELAGEGSVVAAPRLLHCRQALQDMSGPRERAAAANERRVPSRRRRFMLGLE
jgi:hypothetical protein